MTELSFGSTLIVGGTGMLKEASVFLAKHSSLVTLLARKPDALARNLGAKSIVLDWKYHDDALLTIKLLPTFDLIVSWLHQDGIWMAEHLENRLREDGRSIRIHGSISRNPAILAARNSNLRTGIKRQNVILGWVNTPSGQRWLSDDEICAGIIKSATDETHELLIVGTVDD